MDQPARRPDDEGEAPERTHCEAELHLRLCARRLDTGHLQFGWRVERIDYATTEGSSLSGVFGPFQLPHECANEVAAVVRKWMKTAHRRIIDTERDEVDEGMGEQLTLRDFLTE